MKTPDTPATEDARLDTLMMLNVLDTPAEERFDRLTRLASSTFDVPIALVSLVDKDRQWFKSKVGLDACETSRDISFCGHAVASGEALIVRDATKDLRFADNPLVLEDPKIRFYAGIPLKSVTGHSLGTFCIIDSKPREFSDDKIELLQDIAKLAERELTIVHLATVDDLTKILNRRGFKMFSKRLLALSVRYDIPISLVYFDLNKFKPINDKYGHAEGDKVLVEFSNQLKHEIRESDLCGRLGGDEFVALFYDTREDQVEHVVTRISNKLSQYVVENELEYDIQFSHGTIKFEPNKHDSIDCILKEADSLMYQRKKQDGSKRNVA